jgi:hypothetical protein
MLVVADNSVRYLAIETVSGLAEGCCVLRRTFEQVARGITNRPRWRRCRFPVLRELRFYAERVPKGLVSLLPARRVVAHLAS